MLPLFARSSFDEQTVIEGLRAGGLERRKHENALFAHFAYLVKQYQRKYSLPEEEVLSAYSDTVIAVIDNVVKGHFEGRSSLKSYTCQIFMNKCVDAIRKKTTNKNVVNRPIEVDSLVNQLADRSASIVQKLIEKAEKTELMENVRTLMGKCREILLLFEDGYSDQEIALQMQYKSADVVKTTRMRCIEKLKERFISSHSS